MSRILREWLINVPREERGHVGKMLLTGLQREIDWLTEYGTEGDSLIDAIDELCRSIAIPRCIIDATVDYLEPLEFW